jgi:hypothetical protein
MDQIYHSPDLSQLMGKRSRKRYEKLFTGKLMGMRYAEIYTSLLNQDPQPVQAKTPSASRA